MKKYNYKDKEYDLDENLEVFADIIQDLTKSIEGLRIAILRR